MVHSVVLSRRRVVFVVVRVHVLRLGVLDLLLVNGRVVVLSPFLVGFDVILVEEGILGDAVWGEELLRHLFLRLLGQTLFVELYVLLERKRGRLGNSV